MFYVCKWNISNSILSNYELVPSIIYQCLITYLIFFIKVLLVFIIIYAYKRTKNNNEPEIKDKTWFILNSLHYPYLIIMSRQFLGRVVLIYYLLNFSLICIAFKKNKHKYITYNFLWFYPSELKLASIYLYILLLNIYINVLN